MGEAESMTDVNDTNDTANDGTSFTQEQVSAIAAKEARKAANKAKESFVTELGFSTPDELTEVVSAFKAQQDAAKSAETKLAEMALQLESLSKQNEANSESVKSVLATELERIPEEKRSLIPALSPAETLTYIATNRAFLIEQPAPTNVTAGTNTAPAMTNTDTVTFETYKAMTPTEKARFNSESPNLAATYSDRLRGRRY